MPHEKKQLIEEYEANRFTMMVIPINYGSKMYSHIFELEDELISPFKPIDIIKRSCEFFGSSFDGRRGGTKRLIQVTHKAPIVIDPTNSIYIFPTTSPNHSQCIWLFLDHITSYKRLDAKNTLVIFRNKQTHVVPISYASFENQIQRTAFLQTKLSQHLNQTSSLFSNSRSQQMQPQFSAAENNDPYDVF